MGLKSQLLRIYKLHGWAWEELVMDQKMQEMNRLSSSKLSGVVKYLTGVYGSRERLVMAMHKRLVRAGATLVTVFGVLNSFRRHQWLVDDMLYSAKLREARDLFGTANTMYQYLKACYGTGAQVLEALGWVVRTQRSRAKTLAL